MTESLGEREMAVGTTKGTIVIETWLKVWENEKWQGEYNPKDYSYRDMTESLGEREMAVGTQPKRL